MSDIINISFDNSLLKSDVHKQNLVIGSLNLSEFNKRNPESEDLKFEYIKTRDGYDFKLVGHPCLHYSENYLPLMWFADISRNLKWHTQWIKYYPERMYGYFFEYFGRYGEKEIDLFVQLFKDFVPLGNFLSEEHQKQIKNNFNEHCRIAKSYR